GQIVGNGPNNGRTNDTDILLGVDFVNGGTRPVPAAYVWKGTDYKLLSPPQGSFYAATNFGSIPAACGATDLDGHIVGAYSNLQFVEVALDMNAACPSAIPALCRSTATVMVKTRSSASITAELKDF